ncbi:hypothetical protein [Lactiplantibacillus paraplantarum]|uniref:hypothetical protein n=1 Tax=Lactiplantibacillus paraplantarum TaxID=60520 RepID=UPI0023AA6AC4|nr:hypothetical protein [Lactiplantibacillus paraplantarum]WEE36900.1 hypothetical protein PWO93_04695 [Lactiplantibacillus paraplantarum]
MSLKKKNSSANSDIHWLRKIEQTSDKRMAWNFSFLSNEDNFNFSNETLNTDLMLKRIAEINERTFTAFLNLPRTTGLEKIDPNKIQGKLKHKPSPSEFGETREKLSGKKFCVVRLSKSGRIIGKMIDQTFYPFWIDLNHSLYEG